MNKNYIFGVLLIIIGVVIGLNTLDIVSVNLFFKGWWTLFIIVPCFMNIILEKDINDNFIGLIIGIVLLLTVRGIITFDIIWKLFIPFILVITGLSFLFKDFTSKKITNLSRKINTKLKDNDGVSAIFTEQKIDFDGEEFNGTTTSAVFGSVKLNLKEAKIKDDIVITTSSIFGYNEIVCPTDIKVVVKHNSLFGGVENYHRKKDLKDKPVIYINSTNIFGGLKVR